MVYEFKRPIRIIRDKNQIPPVFDETPEFFDSRAFSYKGKIEGIQANIRYTEDCEYFVSTPRKEDLPIVHRIILNRLLGNHNGHERSLADIIRV